MKVKYLGATKAQIMFTGDNPKKLKTNSVYSIKKRKIYRNYTKISLKGIKGEFNSVFFKEI